MSNLLERAIIDAKALKDAAMKNAEKLVIEKYSTEVRDAVDRILESQEERLNEQEDPMADLFADPAVEDEAAPEIPTAEEPAEEAGITADDIQADLPDAFAADDDEIIQIKLDSLEDEIEDEEGLFGGDDEFDDDEIGIDITDEEEAGIDTDVVPDVDTIPDADIGVDIAGIEPAALEEIIRDSLGAALSESDEDLTEEEIDLDDLIERVRVDFDPQKSGWAGTPEAIMREYEAMLLAREQDSKVKEENEELRKAVAALQKENKTLTSAASKLQQQNKKYNTAFSTLQEKLETMNVSNAKLLYINQALENASLNERQKRKIVEAISKAETVQEAKIVFETMNDTVATTSDVKRETTLSEMVSKKSSLLVAARKEQPNKEANPLFNRMQALAGIKTN